MESEIAIEYKNVTKRFAGNQYDSVKNVSLRVEAGTIVTILGTSGSGKTTLLKLTNRIYDLTSGDIEYYGQSISALPVNEYRRKLGYVIQQAGLFPHWTVAENIATIPQMLRWPKDKIRERVLELMQMVELDPDTYYSRYPRQLSGGQQQRVGIARALAAKPSVMLMDEPFGAIDALTRENLQNALIKLQRDIHNTILFVTHDVQEAFKLAHKVIVMDKGEIQQYDTPYNIISAPANDFVRKLVSTGDFYDKFRVLTVTNLIEAASAEEIQTGPRISDQTFLNDALGEFLRRGGEYLIVETEDGKIRGKISYNKIRQLACNGVSK